MQPANPDGSAHSAEVPLMVPPVALWPVSVKSTESESRPEVTLKPCLELLRSAGHLGENDVLQSPSNHFFFSLDSKSTAPITQTSLVFSFGSYSVLHTYNDLFKYGWLKIPALCGYALFGTDWKRQCFRKLFKEENVLLRSCEQPVLIETLIVGGTKKKCKLLNSSPCPSILTPLIQELISAHARAIHFQVSCESGKIYTIEGWEALVQRFKNREKGEYFCKVCIVNDAIPWLKDFSLNGKEVNRLYAAIIRANTSQNLLDVACHHFFVPRVGDMQGYILDHAEALRDLRPKVALVAKNGTSETLRDGYELRLRDSEGRQHKLVFYEGIAPPPIAYFQTLFFEMKTQGCFVLQAPTQALIDCEGELVRELVQYPLHPSEEARFLAWAASGFPCADPEMEEHYVKRMVVHCEKAPNFNEALAAILWQGLNDIEHIETPVVAAIALNVSMRLPAPHCNPEALARLWEKLFCKMKIEESPLWHQIAFHLCYEQMRPSILKAFMQLIPLFLDRAMIPPGKLKRVSFQLEGGTCTLPFQPVEAMQDLVQQTFSPQEETLLLNLFNGIRQFRCLVKTERSPFVQNIRALRPIAKSSLDHSSAVVRRISRELLLLSAPLAQSQDELTPVLVALPDILEDEKDPEFRQTILEIVIDRFNALYQKEMTIAQSANVMRCLESLKSSAHFDKEKIADLLLEVFAPLTGMTLPQVALQLRQRFPRASVSPRSSCTQNGVCVENDPAMVNEAKRHLIELTKELDQGALNQQDKDQMLAAAVMSATKQALLLIEKGHRDLLETLNALYKKAADTLFEREESMPFIALLTPASGCLELACGLAERRLSSRLFLESEEVKDGFEMLLSHLCSLLTQSAYARAQIIFSHSRFSTCLSTKKRLSLQVLLHATRLRLIARSEIREIDPTCFRELRAFLPVCKPPELRRQCLDAATEVLASFFRVAPPAWQVLEETWMEFEKVLLQSFERSVPVLNSRALQHVDDQGLLKQLTHELSLADLYGRYLFANLSYLADAHSVVDDRERSLQRFIPAWLQKMKRTFSELAIPVADLDEFAFVLQKMVEHSLKVVSDHVEIEGMRLGIIYALLSQWIEKMPSKNQAGLKELLIGFASCPYTLCYSVRKAHNFFASALVKLCNQKNLFRNDPELGFALFCFTGVTLETERELSNPKIVSAVHNLLEKLRHGYCGIIKSFAMVTHLRLTFFHDRPTLIQKWYGQILEQLEKQPMTTWEAVEALKILGLAIFRLRTEKKSGSEQVLHQCGPLLVQCWLQAVSNRVPQPRTKLPVEALPAIALTNVATIAGVWVGDFSKEMAQHFRAFLFHYLEEERKKVAHFRLQPDSRCRETIAYCKAFNTFSEGIFHAGLERISDGRETFRHFWEEQFQALLEKVKTVDMAKESDDIKNQLLVALNNNIDNAVFYKIFTRRYLAYLNQLEAFLDLVHSKKLYDVIDLTQFANILLCLHADMGETNLSPEEQSRRTQASLKWMKVFRSWQRFDIIVACQTLLCSVHIANSIFNNSPQILAELKAIFKTH